MVKLKVLEQFYHYIFEARSLASSIDYYQINFICLIKKLNYLFIFTLDM